MLADIQAVMNGDQYAPGSLITEEYRLLIRQAILSLPKDSHAAMPEPWVDTEGRQEFLWEAEMWIKDYVLHIRPFAPTPHQGEESTPVGWWS